MRRFPRVVALAVLAAGVVGGCQPTTGILVDDVPLPPPPKEEKRPWSILEDVPRMVPRRNRQEGPVEAKDRKPGEPKATAQAPKAEWIASEPGKWTYIILHHSAGDFGNADVFDRLHRQRGWDELGYHFVIGNGKGVSDGAVEVGPRWLKQKHGAHCRIDTRDDNRWNEHGIGVCLVGDFTRRRPSEAQMASAARLVGWLMRQSGIPRESVLGHGQVSGAKTDCPGRLFPYDDLFRRIAAADSR